MSAGKSKSRLLGDVRVSGVKMTENERILLQRAHIPQPSPPLRTTKQVSGANFTTTTTVKSPLLVAAEEKLVELSKLLEEAIAKEKNSCKEAGKLKLHNSTLHKSNVDLSKQCRDLSADIDALRADTLDYKSLYEKEVSSHSTTKEELSIASNELEAQTENFARLQHECDEKFRLQLKQHHDELGTIKREHEELVRDLQDKIDNIKKAMADTLQGKSWERQHQIEDLQKDLQNMQQENDRLRAKTNRHSKDDCAQCEKYKQMIDETVKTLKEREEYVKRLQSNRTRNS